MRLIDAVALKNYILINNVGCGCSEDYQKSFLTAVEDQPTVESQIAHWIIDGHHIQCSKCGETMCNTDREGDPIPRNFCPNCGARMVTE